jgi:hypothetical protein
LKSAEDQAAKSTLKEQIKIQPLGKAACQYTTGIGCYPAGAETFYERDLAGLFWSGAAKVVGGI